MKLTKAFVEDVRELIVSARTTVARGVDLVQVHTNFEIGRRIVEQEQKGKGRAAYGQEVVRALAERLTEEFGDGFSKSNLEYMRRFYLAYELRIPIAQTVSGQSARRLIPQSEPAKRARSDIAQTVSGQSTRTDIFQTASGKSVGENIPQSLSGKLAKAKIVQTLSALSDLVPIGQTLSDQSRPPFTLSWSHYVFLLGIKDADERSFYEIEATAQDWTVRELKRQFDSSLYERLALSRDKAGIRQLAKKGQLVEKPQDLLKAPLVLEFLGLDGRAEYSESELEKAVIDRLEHFLLELGKGFLFEARQRRFTFGSDHFFVDLVFYNRLLRCYVLIDLKIGRITHQDVGQMQMYVNYFDRHVKAKGEKATIGIVLCKEKNDALVEITLPKGANIHAREYQLYLPSKQQLRKKLKEWAAEAEGR